MRKILLLPTLFLFLLATSVLGYADITYNFNVYNVQVEAYDCLDSSCNSVGTFSGYFPDGQSTSNGQLTIVFPSSLQTPYGYAVFYFSSGYVPMEALATWHTYGDDTHYYSDYNIDFYKISNCHSTIDSFNVTNDVYANMPLVVNMSSSLDASTYSAFYETNNAVGYIPDAYKDEYYSADTRVTLSIYDNNDNLVSQQIKAYTADNGNPLYMDQSQKVEFSWTPTINGSYTAVVQTEIIDDQCSSSTPQSSSKEFTVFPALPQNECYTLLNNLKTDDPYPIEGNQITISYDKTSNYADQSSQLTAIPTDVDYEIINSTGSVVYSDSLTLSANPDTVNPVTYSFRWTPSVSGWYNISVAGIGSSTLCAGLNNPSEKVEEEIYVKAPPTYNVTFQLSDSLNGSKVVNALVDVDGNSGYTDSNGQVTLVGFTSGTYTYTITHPEYYNVTGSLEVTDVNLVIFLTMTHYNRPPVIEGIPNVYMDEDTIYNYIDLDDYISDSESADSELTLTYSGNTNIAVSIDAEHVLTLTPSSDWTGSELITFTVTDPEGAYDSDDMLVTVDDVNDAPVISGLPDITLDMNTNLFDAFYLGDYASDLETPFSALTLSIIGNTNPEVGVSIGPDNKVDIQPDNDWFGVSVVTIMVSDGELNNTDDFNITVNYVAPQIFECNDGVDNDGDGLVDLADPGCSSSTDDDESDGTSQCQDNIDNDGDGAVDYPDDFSCSSPQDDDETNPLAECQNGVDDDGDNLTDMADSGCSDSQDNDEFNYYQCNDGIDNDGDGYTDYPDDIGCDSSFDNDEFNYFECNDGTDNDNDGAVDYPDDFSCDSPFDNNESYPQAQCQDGVDNDGDGLVDLADPGCSSLQDNDESDVNVTYQCNDGIDNDGDGLIDMADPGCDSPTDNDEYNAPVTQPTPQLEEPERGLTFSRIRIMNRDGIQDVVQRGDVLMASITLYNNEDVDLDDLKITIGIPDLGVYTSGGNLDLDEGDAITRYLILEIPPSAIPGIYYVRIVVYGDGLKRIKHRPFNIV
jgi:hypothetical protein